MEHARQVVQEMYNGIRTIVSIYKGRYTWVLLDKNNVVLASSNKSYDRMHSAQQDAFYAETEYLKDDN